jgi:4-hydroxythreonine-4-phosphate dehydrogenase
MTTSSDLTTIVITPGEAAGIGPDVTLAILQQPWNAHIVVVADPELMRQRAALLNIAIIIHLYDPNQPRLHQPGSITVLPVLLRAPCLPGQLSQANAPYVIECLEIATDFCLNHAAALVTGPVQKSIINEANIPFTGHTEFLAQRCGVEQSLMLFDLAEMKVVLMTTHIPLSAVSAAITTEKVTSTIRLLQTELQKKYSINNPHIYVCGLNPHAGENGHLGREEIECIEPALQRLKQEGIAVVGPLPADTIFTQHYLDQADVIVAMYHDQALPLVKYLGFDRAVNVTLGLPIIRTSVDHGTALDIAGTGKANAGSLNAAIRIAMTLAQPI